MAQLNVQSVNLSGQAIALAAADAAGDSFANDGKTTFRISNGSAAAITATIASPTPCNYGFTHDDAVSVNAGQELEIGPFSTARFNDSKGNVNVTYSAAASVTVAAVRN